jgi:signal transduction histidine kinase/putative methionine-R-sulfoxide reductase with GAF domain
LEVSMTVRSDDLGLLRRAAEELLLASNDESAILDRAVGLLNDHFGYGTHYILLHDAAANELYVATAAGIGSDRPAVRAYRAPISVGLTGEAARTRRTVNVADVRDDPRYVPAIVEALSEMCVPIVSGQELIGVLSVQHTEPNAFDRHDDDVLTALAQLVALAILHARAFREIAAQHARSVRDAEDRALRELTINRIASKARASLDPAELLRSALPQVGEALRCAHVVLWLGGADSMTAAAAWPIGTDSALDLARASEAIDLARTVVGARGDRHAMLTPIVLGGHHFGFLDLERSPEAGKWTEGDMRLVEAIGRELALATGTAELYQARERESQRLLALHEASSDLAGETDYDRIVDLVLSGAVALLGQGGGSLYRFDPPGELRLFKSVVAEHQLEAIAPAQSAAALAFERRAPVAAGNSLAVPLMRSGTAIGALVVVAADAAFRFSADDGRLLNLFGDQAVAAITVADAFLSEQRGREQIEELSRAKSDFVSVVSHEFRTPLTGIQGFAELLRDEALSPEEVREYAGDIFTDAQRLNRMINDMLDLDRMESGRMVVHREAIDLNELVTRTVGRAQLTAPKHRLRAAPGAAAIIQGDPDKLTQVLTNLIGNAIKYSPDGGEIVVTTSVAGNLAAVAVRDHGMGIPAAALESVFERYARVDRTETRNIRGTGLGLPIVRQIVTMHGGSVWAESTVGDGSTFHFTVPLAEPTPA